MSAPEVPPSPIPAASTASLNQEAKDDSPPAGFSWCYASPADPRYAEWGQIRFTVPTEDLKFRMKPTHCGPKVIFINSQDEAYYMRKLPNPKITLWILTLLPVLKSHALKRLYETGRKQNIQVDIMQTNNFELVASKEGLETVLYEGKQISLPDCIICRVGAAVDYFGLAVIRQLEKMGCLVLNQKSSIEISRDKLLTVQHLAAHGLPIPKTILAKFPMNLDTIKREFTYPLIIKKASGSQGKGIIKVDSHEQLMDIIDMIDIGKPLMFQEMIQASKGRDLRVFVIGGRVVGAMMRIATGATFKANVHQGATVKMVQCSAQVEWLVLETVKIIGLDIAGVDLLIDKDTYKICEVNSSPGFEGLEIALGMDIAARMLQYMKMRLGDRRPMMVKQIHQVVVPIFDEESQPAGLPSAAAAAAAESAEGQAGPSSSFTAASSPSSAVSSTPGGITIPKRAAAAAAAASAAAAAAAQQTTPQAQPQPQQQ